MKILIVEDEKLARLTLKGYLKGHDIDEAMTLAEATKLLTNNHYDLVFLDLDLDVKLAGLKLARICKEKNLYSVIITGHSEDKVMETGYLNGARDYLFKPLKSTDVDFILTSFHVFESEHRIGQLIKAKYVTQHAATIEELNVIKRVYLSTKPILIKGPTGTGKSIVANLIKEACQIPDEKFMAINCAQFSDNLLESELFGHKKGSFTGATENKIGIFEKVNGGMIFLDEIHSLSKDAQKKLMKAIEEKTFFPVGSTIPVHSNFRVVTATCEDLTELIEQKAFRPDFYARIGHIQIQLYSLKDRTEDIMPLVNHYAGMYARKFTLTAEVKEAILKLDLKNNTRDIEALVDHWNLNSIGVVKPEHIPAQFIKDEPKSSRHKLTRMQRKQIEENGLKEFLDSYRDGIILQYLEHNNQHQSKTAKDLKISDRTIRHALKSKPNLITRYNEEIPHESSIQ